MNRYINNTLYLNDCADIQIKNENIQVGSNKIPLKYISIVIVGVGVHLSNTDIILLVRHNIEIILLTYYNEFGARIIGDVIGNVELRTLQYRYMQSSESLSLVNEIVTGKIRNQQKLLQKVAYNHSESREIIENTIGKMDLLLVNEKMTVDIDSIRGIEGRAAQLYFNTFNELIKNKEFEFKGRSRRPPLDEVNAMLSYGYAILLSRVYSALNMVGLDQYVGFMHSIKSGKPSLALDIMEELRPHMCDRFVLNLINLGIIQINMFEHRDDGVFLNNDGKRELVKYFNSKYNSIVFHKVFNENILMGDIPYYQARLLTQHLRGTNKYKAYLWS